MLETLKETLHGGGAKDIFGTYITSELRRFDAKFGKIEITNTLNRLVTNQFCGNLSSQSFANIQQQYLNNSNDRVATLQSVFWMENYTGFLKYRAKNPFNVHIKVHPGRIGLLNSYNRSATSNMIYLPFYCCVL